MGARVYATRSTGVCAAGEPGLVVEAYEIGSRPGRSVIFQAGGYDGFSPEDLKAMLTPEGSVDERVAVYAFQNVKQLFNDWRAGKFRFGLFEPYASWLASRERSELSSLASDPDAARGQGPRL